MRTRGANLLKFQMGNKALSKISNMKEYNTFRYIEQVKLWMYKSFEIIECDGNITHKLNLPKVLSGIHDVFHISNLKK